MKHHAGWGNTCNDAADALGAVRGDERAKLGVPATTSIAYRFPKAGINNGYHYSDNLDGEEDRFKPLWQPVYAAPQAPTPPAAMVPRVVTGEDVGGALRVYHQDKGISTYTESVISDMRRALEAHATRKAAHGIGTQGEAL